jgi:hypothetical protein
VSAGGFPDDLLTVQAGASELRAALERLRHRFDVVRAALVRIGAHSGCDSETASEMIVTARVALEAEEKLPRCA